MRYQQSAAPYRDIIEAELAFYQGIESKLTEAHSKRLRQSTLRERFLDIRTQAAEAHIDDLPALHRELRSLQEHADQIHRSQLPDINAPYFAHISVEYQQGTKDIFIGYQTYISGDIRILNWQRAPMARVFFNHEEGEDFEETVGPRVLEGVLKTRRTLAFRAGQLVQIATPEVILQRGDDGAWQRVEALDIIGRITHQDPAIPLPLGTGQTWHSPPPISALLDATQYQAIHTPAQTPLLLLGGAGCGKTTVALHRLVRLFHENLDAGRPPEGFAVVVPEGGLSRLVEILLKKMGTVDIPVYTFDQWIIEIAKTLMPDYIPRINREAGPDIIRLKRHPALKFALKAWALRYRQSMAERLLKAGGLAFNPPTLPALPEDHSLLATLNHWVEVLMPMLQPQWQSTFDREVEAIKIGLLLPENSVATFFGEGTLLAIAQAHSEGILTEKCLEKTLSRSRMQLMQKTEHYYAGGDKVRLRAVDGLPIDQRSRFELASQIDIEDFPILFEMQRLKLGGLKTTTGEVPHYQHLVIDEAQALSCLELSALAHCLEEPGQLTLSGDEAQHIDESSNFTNWSDHLGAMGTPTAKTIHLTTNYRCPKPIMDLGEGVLGDHQKGKSRAHKDGAPVLFSHYEDPVKRAIALIQTLEQLIKSEGRAQIAVIAKTPRTAQAIYEAIYKNIPCRRVEEGHFEFRPGIDITDVQQVKGLEFDYVIIPDAGLHDYPDSPANRRILHVAITRAIHQLWVMHVGQKSPILEGL